MNCLPGYPLICFFVLFVNYPEIMHFSYQRYLENKLRESFGFEGTPIHMIIRAKNEEEQN